MCATSICRSEKKMAFIGDGRVSLGGCVCVPKKMVVEVAATACVVGDKEEVGCYAHAGIRHVVGFTSSLEAIAVTVTATTMKSSSFGDGERLAA
ncbi:hypothetical protein GUJ93_ZPchr0008g13267 [Zizania palustris]|uniref:Uncharacterized protein n=1 Tax=Zizania palustris TaxID=103762 RepID=A0A8J5RCY4_ZIZPA|nr:hypothetical protein GUJ93_ZPchr0008g13267 [Zizania palustris]